MNNPVELEQMYRHKDGSYFKATDTHRIFLNPEGCAIHLQMVNCLRASSFRYCVSTST